MKTEESAAGYIVGRRSGAILFPQNNIISDISDYQMFRKILSWELKKASFISVKMKYCDWDLIF